MSMTTDPLAVPPEWSSDHHKGSTHIAGLLDARLTVRR
jgi:hypothetical protein